MSALISTSRMIGKLAMEHAPTVLTISAIGGVGATAFLSGRAAIRVMDIKVGLEYQSETKPTRKEYVKATWKEFVPPILMGGATIACIVFAHRIHLQRQAAIMAAYSVLSDKYNDYRHEVIQELGEKKENRIQDTIAQNKVNAGYNGLNIIHTGYGDILFMDSFTGRYFYSSYEAVEKAKIRVTQIAQSEICVSLNDFYTALEIPTTDGGAILGWNVNDISDQIFENVVPIMTNRVCKTPTPEELPCVVIDYQIEPVVDFDKSF